MYLTRFNQKQKKIFLELAYQIASADGNYSLCENEMMIAYCNEMGLDPETQIKSRKLEEIVAEINKEFGIVEKKIVIFETVGLAMVDGNFDANEKGILTKVQDAIGIASDYFEQCEHLLTSYIKLQNQINATVIEQG